MKIYVMQPGMKACAECGGTARVELDVGATGYGVGSGHEHVFPCKQRWCSHGKLHSEICEGCNAEELEREANVVRGRFGGEE